MSRLAPLALVALLFALAPGAASACSVCFAGEEESRSAFIWTALLLSVLPPGMVGGMVWWIWRRSRARDAAGADERRLGDPARSPRTGPQPTIP